LGREIKAEGKRRQKVIEKRKGKKKKRKGKGKE